MRIAFTKLSDERHRLEILRDRRDGGCAQPEAIECETRSYLRHDLLHFAVEVEAGVASGFWGRLAAGSTLAEMNDRARVMSPDMAAIEQVVGALSGGIGERSAADLVAGMRRFATSLHADLPGWLTASLVDAVQERMRRLVGQWNATPYRDTMVLEWPLPEVP